MKEELEKELFDKYPKIFRQKDLPMQVTAMCWGIDVGDGWYDLIDSMCHQIQHHIDWRNGCGVFEGRESENLPDIQVETTQVKEKFGGLRFYYNGGDDFVEGIVRLGEAMSYKICEICGNKGEVSKERWVTTRCKAHEGKRKWLIADG